MLKLPVRPADSEERKDQGFTLIELLVVVLIIGVLAAIAIPVFLNQREKAADAGTKSDMKNAATLMETYFVDTQDYGGTGNGPVGATAATATQLTEMKSTDGVTVTVVSANQAGFCLRGSSTGGDKDGSAAAKYFYYDSGNGGMLASTAEACVADYTDAG